MASLSSGGSDGPNCEVLLVVAESGQPTTSDPFPGWVRRVRAEHTDSHPWTITKVLYSVGSFAGGEGRLADSDGISSIADVTTVVHGWDLIPGIRNVGLVHICRPFTRAGEIALLAAKLLGKKTVLSDLDFRTSTVGASFGITDLADCLVCQSGTEAESYPGHHHVAILDLSSDESESALCDIYTEVVGDGVRAP